MRRQGLTVLALLPVLALGTSACGNGNTLGATAGATRKAATSDLDKMREYARCMRANGVDMPDPSAEGGRIKLQQRVPKGGEAKLSAAERKCRHLMPNGGKPIKPNAEQLAQMRAMAKCMRENGVAEFPDPDPNSGGIVMKRGGKGKSPAMDPEDPVFQAAHKKCRGKEQKAPMLSGRGR